MDYIDTLDLDAPEVIENIDDIDTTDDDFDAWFNAQIADAHDEGEDFYAEDEADENWFPEEDEAAAPLKVRDAAACRSWARENGYTVGTRGVIAETIWAAWQAA